MQLFRRLATNIIFKIILSFVLLSFVLFGVSEFILNSPNSWVAKVGNSTISVGAFNKALRSDREMILNSSKSEDTLKYLDSDRFKSDVLGRMVNKMIVEKLHDEFGVEANKKLILEAVAKDNTFKNNEGKFDHKLFKEFLAKHGFDEKKYIEEVSNEIIATMVIQSIAMASPTNINLVAATESFKQEKRRADLVKISTKNLKKLPSATNEEIEEFFETNRNKYSLPEIRQVSYLRFSKKDFARDMKLTDSDIKAEYEKTKDQFKSSESRNLYHILFEKEESAQNFASKLNDVTKGDKSKNKAEFAKLAAKMEKKRLKDITLKDVTKKDLIPELSETVFSLKSEEVSPVVKSPLGFHVFLLIDIKESQPVPFSQVKNSIRDKLLKNREDKVLQAKISKIDDLLLTSNSLSEVAKTFKLKNVKTVTIDESGQTKNVKLAKEIDELADFAQNAFSLAKGQASKIFYAKNADGFYALKIEEIEPAREQTLNEVKSEVISDVSARKKEEALYELSQKIGAEIKENPKDIAKIAAKFGLKLEKNREFPRVVYINLQGRQIPYKNEFLDSLFKVKLGEATEVLPSGEQEFIVGVLRKIETATIESKQLFEASEMAKENFKTEILKEFNSYLLKKNPVVVNEKFFGQQNL